ncbi:MAG: hypothetical protein J6Q79_00460 [Clostridia bacterium]|nr:hypothetical protein [Clostridia bacterium]
MKKIMKSTVSLMLVIAMVSSFCLCFASAEEKQYDNYEKVMLLGDSEASGFADYSDVMSEFTRVDDSYAAYVADELGAEFIPMACPGFRTIELRYMLDDSYRPDDKYLFTEVPHTPMNEILEKAPAMKQAIKESDLIMIGIGGNDWGAYLGWVAEDIQNANNLPEEYKAALREFLKKATLKDDVIAQIIDLADKFNALDDLIKIIPGALNYAFSNLRTNWEYIVEYIYENNPDVTLAVIGMFPTYYQTPEGQPDLVAQPDAAKVFVEDAIIDFGNKHMIEGQEKYGYIYVRTHGAIVEVSHPTVAGHRFIADRILEALPYGDFPYADVNIRSKYYSVIEYMWLNDIIDGVTDTEFSPDEALTKGVLENAFAKLAGSDASSTDETKAKRIDVIKAILNADNSSFIAKLKTFGYAISLFINGGKFNITAEVTRAEGAKIIYDYINL